MLTRTIATFFLLTAFSRLHAAQTATDDWNKVNRAEWSACQSAQECTASLSECNGLDPVNVKHVATHDAWMANLRPRVNCSSQSFRNEKELQNAMRKAGTELLCVQSRCTVKNPPPASIR